MSSHLFLCSTPLHILNAVAIASNENGSCHIALIDQPNTSNNPYYQILKEWSESPFVSIHLFEGRIKGLRKKLKSRKKVFTTLKSIVSNINPSAIYTGNDRRIEFQYSMHCATQHNPNVSGVYMDEGTFTYIGRKASLSFSDRYLDNAIKKITYGFWWRNPSNIGASSWITQVYAAFPKLIHQSLTHKQVIPLQPLYTNNKAVDTFCSRVFNFFGKSSQNIGQLDVVFTLPHESIITSVPDYQVAIEQVIDDLLQSDTKIGIKYHPRNTNPDILGAHNKPEIVVLPHQIPFEAVLPHLDNCTIVGDVSSTLINSRFLQPSCDVISISNPNVPMYDAFVEFFSLINVNTVTPNELQSLLTKKFHHA